MKITIFDCYLIGAAAVGFLIYLVNVLMHSIPGKKPINIIVAIAALLGGSLGVILSALITGRKHIIRI